MSSNNEDDLTPEVKALLARVNRPIPLRVRREMNVCVDMDLFAAALEATRDVLSAALSRPADISPYASPAAVQASWKDSLAELQASFEKTDERALALIRSIKVMLVLE